MNPVRTCLGCRQRGEQSTLLRVVARDGLAVADPSATLPGRGSWVHPTIGCVDTAIKRKAFGRALKSGVALDASQVLTHVTASTEAPDEQAD